MLSSQYIYASGKIRALEPQILDATDIERMVDAPDFVTAFKVLNDTDYADNLLDVEAVNYRDALRADYAQMYKLLQNIIPDENLIKLLYLDRDFLVIKALIKGKYFDQKEQATKMFAQDTVHKTKDLSDYIFKGVDNGLSRRFKKAIDNAQARLSENPNPADIDVFLTQELFEVKKKLAKKINNKIISEIINTQIQSANLLLILRAKRYKLNKDQVKNQLLESDTIKPHEWLNMYEGEDANLKPFVSAQYDDKVVEAFSIYLDQDALFPLEKSLDDYLIKKLQQIKMIPYGPEVVFSYFTAKSIAVQNIRLIMTGKINQIPAEEIKKTLRMAY